MAISGVVLVPTGTCSRLGIVDVFPQKKLMVCYEQHIAKRAGPLNWLFPCTMSYVHVFVFGRALAWWSIYKELCCGPLAT